MGSSRDPSKQKVWAKSTKEYLTLPGSSSRGEKRGPLAGAGNSMPMSSVGKKLTSIQAMKVLLALQPGWMQM